MSPLDLLGIVIKIANLHYTTSNLIIEYSLSTNAIIIFNKLSVFTVRVSIIENMLAVTVNIIILGKF